MKDNNIDRRSLLKTGVFGFTALTAGGIAGTKQVVASSTQKAKKSDSLSSGKKQWPDAVMNAGATMAFFILTEGGSSKSGTLLASQTKGKEVITVTKNTRNIAGRNPDYPDEKHPTLDGCNILDIKTILLMKLSKKGSENMHFWCPVDFQHKNVFYVPDSVKPESVWPGGVPTRAELAVYIDDNGRVVAAQRKGYEALTSETFKVGTDPGFLDCEVRGSKPFTLLKLDCPNIAASWHCHDPYTCFIIC